MATIVSPQRTLFLGLWKRCGSQFRVWAFGLRVRDVRLGFPFRVQRLFSITKPCKVAGSLCCIRSAIIKPLPPTSHGMMGVLDLGREHTTNFNEPCAHKEILQTQARGPHILQALTPLKPSTTLEFPQLCLFSAADAQNNRSGLRQQCTTDFCCHRQSRRFVGFY